MKNKMIAAVEIGVVLCSVLVSASAITSASEFYVPGPLDVFGNANEDDTIDMRDLTFTARMILRLEDETELADANYDGRISVADMTQIGLIILGRENKLTYIDIFGEAETVNKPIKRLANIGWAGINYARYLDAMDILLPVVMSDKSDQPIFYPEISKFKGVGWEVDDIDWEYIHSLEPDAVQPNIEATWALGPAGEENKRILKEKLPGIPLICLNLRQVDTLPENVRTLGYIYDRGDEAEELIDWFEGYYDMFESRIDGLSEDEKLRFYYESGNRDWHAIASGNANVKPVLWAGGKNILDEIAGPDDPLYSIWMDVDPEWVAAQNPDFIFTRGNWHQGDYETDDTSEYAAARQAILDRPELADVDAVKNGRVYVLDTQLMGGLSDIHSAAYATKILNPELFADIDPREIRQEYVDKFCRIDFNVYDHGVFVYPPPEYE